MELSQRQILYEPDLIYAGSGSFTRAALVTNANGKVERLAHQEDSEALSAKRVRLEGRALLPGLVNAHSHAFQRVLRGRTETRSSARDSFWTWREMMYEATRKLAPEDVYDVSRMAFFEMLLSGITTVGEFHYLNRDTNGVPYSDPNLLAKEVIRAAADTGIRIALLRSAYARGGYERALDSRQARFVEPDAGIFMNNTDELIRYVNSGSSDPGPCVRVGVAPHSVRALPLEYLRQVFSYAEVRGLPVHMHVSEQPAEVSDCLREYGRRPVELLRREGLLGANFTAVHAIHVSEDEVEHLAQTRARVCACPATERNLGDGVFPADAFFKGGIPVSLGTDSQVQIDLLEDARELEYHLRLKRLKRVVLVSQEAAHQGGEEGQRLNLCGLASRLFQCSTIEGAAALGVSAGELLPGKPADFFTVDLNDVSIAGATNESLLPTILFSLSRAAIRDVAIGGKVVITNGRHEQQDIIVKRFSALQKKLWG